MNAIESLSNDHRLIERMIAALDAAAVRLQDGEPIRPGFFVDAARFIRDFADGCHHRKEEGVLFKALEGHGLDPDSGPIGVMLYEHEEGRGHAKRLRGAADRLVAGDGSAVDDIVESARAYAELLRAHIYKEDHILFRMAEQMIPPGEQDDVMDAFERVERERPNPSPASDYYALVDALEAEMRPLVR
jgi:hemerythrin-like domain-containing protein